MNVAVYYYMVVSCINPYGIIAFWLGLLPFLVYGALKFPPFLLTILNVYSHVNRKPQNCLIVSHVYLI